MRYKYIFWDFNGTILDDVNAALACVNDMLSRKNRDNISLEQYYEYVETPIIGFYRHILPPEELNFSEISADYHKDYLNHTDKITLANGAAALIKRLKDNGAHQYIVTANQIDEALGLLSHFGITDYFDEILGAENTLAESKIERAELLFNSLKIDRNQAVFIGDTLHDYEVANALGIDCILVAYGHQGRKLLESRKAFTAENLFEAEKIIFDERTVDLHTHSNCSDGTLSPTELMRYAKEKGLSAIALTDHDTVDGIKEASEEALKLGLDFIPGIEFSAAEETETHIIGLFIDYENETLLSTIEKLRSHRRRRMEEICLKLQNLGLSITIEECLDLSEKGFVGRAHIAKLMVTKGYCSTIQECFEKYIGLGKPAYAEKNELTAIEAVHAIKAAGGLAFLAHLHQTKYNTESLKKLLVQLKAEGLDGIEGYYTEYQPHHIREYRNLGLELSLAFSGGSDFHAQMKPHIEIGKGTGNLAIPYYTLDNLKRILEKSV